MKIGLQTWGSEGGYPALEGLVRVGQKVTPVIAGNIPLITVISPNEIASASLSSQRAGVKRTGRTGLALYHQRGRHPAVRSSEEAWVRSHHGDHIFRG
jgi:hypothetical protein